MESRIKWILAIVVLLLFLPESKKSQQLSGLRKRRSKKLFYISQGKVIPRSEIETAKSMTRAGYGKVYAVWAYNADEARDYIQQGKAEIISGIGYTQSTKADLAPLRDETKNYNSAEEFYESFYGKGGRRMTESGEYHSDRIARIAQIDDEYNPKLMNFIKLYPDQTRSIPGLNMIKGNEKTVTIYRSATGDIRPGDWIALSSEYAKGHSRTKTHKMYSMKVPVSDVRWAGTSAEEWFYAPSESIKELKSFDPKRFYNEVLKGDLDGLNYNPVFQKGDEAELVNRYGNVPVGKRGTITKVWINPVSNEQWVRLFYGKNLTGQRLQQSYPVNVLKKVRKSEQEPKAKMIPESKGQMTLFGRLSAVPTGNEIYMQSSPISKELQHRFEQTTFYPYDMNKEFNESVEARETEAINKLKNYGYREIPEDVQTALAYYRKSLYDFLVTKAIQVPGPMITGPSKYNYKKLDKSIAREDKAFQSVEIAKEYLEKAVKRNTKGKSTTVQQESRTRWKAEAIHTSKKEFANKVFQAAYDRASPSLQKNYDNGAFVTSIKNKGRKFHKELIDEAVAEGIEIDPIVKKDYPEKFGIESQAKARKPKTDAFYDEFIKKQQESERIAQEWSRPSREKAEIIKKRIEERNKPKLIEEKGGQMTLFGNIKTFIYGVR